MIVLRFPTATHFRIRALEWLLAGVLLTWAVILAQPFDTTAQPNFAELRRIGGDTFWALVCGGIGLARLGALYVNGAWVPSPWVRMATALLSACFWLQVVLGMSASGVVTTGLAVYPWFIFCDLYSIGRAAQDARLSREERLLKPEAPVTVPPVQ